MDNHNEGGNQLTMAEFNPEAPGADDLLLDNEDAVLGKVGLFFKFVLYLLHKIIYDICKLLYYPKEN